MNFKEVVIGQTVCGLPIKGYLGQTVKESRWLYFISGIYGDDVEGIYVVEKIHKWLQDSFVSELPILIIPILNIDGYQSQYRFNGRGIDLNRNFPMTSGRIQKMMKKGQKIQALEKEKPFSEPETFYFKKTLDRYPPQLIMTFHSVHAEEPPAILPFGDADGLAEYVAKYNKYEIIKDSDKHPFSLELFAYDYYGTSVINLKLPKIDRQKSFQDIWQENAQGLQNLLLGQTYY